MKKRGYLTKIMRSAVVAASISLPVFGLSPSAYADNTPPASDVTATAVNDNLYIHKTLASHSTAPVGAQLVLALDTSGSMSDEEMKIEFKATAYALNSELFRSVIKYKSGAQSVAVAVIDFSSRAHLRVPWVDLRGAQLNDKPYNAADPVNSSQAPDKLDMLAQEIEGLNRRNGGTVIHKAIYLSQKLYLGSPWALAKGGKRVLDIFGDGKSEVTSLHYSRDEIAAMGVTINAFAIVNEEPDLDEFFRRHLITSKYIEAPDGSYSEPGRVWVVARNMKEKDNEQEDLKAFFGEVVIAMKQKITVEVAGIDAFRRVLVRLDRKPAFPVPKPL